VRRDFSTAVVILTIVVLIVLYFYAGYTREKQVEVRQVTLQGITVHLPPGFHRLNKLERESYGFPPRVEALKKGDFEELLLIDVETGLPTSLDQQDLSEYRELSRTYLQETIQDFKLISHKVNRKEFSYSFVYSGKGREGPFYALYFSRIVPGKKINVTISGPDGSLETLKRELSSLKITF